MLYLHISRYKEQIVVLILSAQCFEAVGWGPEVCELFTVQIHGLGTDRLD